MTIADSGSWTIGTIAGIIFTGLLTLSIPALIWWGIRLWRNTFDRELAWIPFVGSGLAGALTVVMLSPMALYPYSGEYHQLRHVSGTVAAIEKRLVSTGDGMEEKYVVTFDDSPQEFRIDDTRASLVQVGDSLTVTCRRVWQYASTHGYVCNWIGVDPR